MASIQDGLTVQVRVIQALTSRELMTRFGRQNIGFLWIMVEPLLFAGLVGVLWSFLRGPEAYGLNILAFVMTGYVPLTFLRQSFGRSASIFVANSALLYHRQIKVFDFILVRVLIEGIGTMMAFLFAAIVLFFFGVFPVPEYTGPLLAGWAIYAFFIFSVCTILAPLSEVSEVVEKLIPVSVYISIPFSGVFNLASWLPPSARDALMWSPLVSGMELMRYGVFGDAITPYYDVSKALGISMVCLIIGLILCRRVRRSLSVQ